jgi:ribosomal 30S subunit maturation factor RimM
MKAERSTGEQIGAVTAYYELPQGIMLDVETATGSVLIPYRPEIVRSADVANRILVIDDTLGFLE